MREREKERDWEREKGKEKFFPWVVYVGTYACACGCLSMWRSEVNFLVSLLLSTFFFRDKVSNFINFTSVCVCVCTWSVTTLGDTSATALVCVMAQSVMALMKRLEDNSWDTVLNFHHVGPRVADKHLYPLLSRRPRDKTCYWTCNSLIG